VFNLQEQAKGASGIEKPIEFALKGISREKIVGNVSESVRPSVTSFSSLSL